MASIANDPGGRRRILFMSPSGDRKAIRLGKVSGRSAEGFKYRIEQLLEATMLRRPMDAELAQWVAELDAHMSKKLAAVGLIPKREAKPAATLGEHLTNYFKRRTDVKPSTLTHWRQAQRTLLAYFGADRLLTAITAGEARDWERWLKTGEARENRYAGREATEGLAPNTVHKRISDAKQFFQDAVQRELLSRNPFDGLQGTVGGNRERRLFYRPRNRREGTRRLPGRPMAFAICPQSLRRPALPIGTSGDDLGRCKLGREPDAHPQLEDRAPRR